MNSFSKTASVALLASMAVAGWSQLNVAASSNGGVASQSSTWGDGVASRSNDGNRNGNWSNNSVSHTDRESNAWWESHFFSSSVIDHVIVFNRTDSVSWRINPFSVILYLGNSIVWQQNQNTFTPDIVDTEISGMTCNVGGVLADRFRVQLDQTEYLNMAEGEAWTPVPEPATLTALGIGLLWACRKRRQAG